MYKKLGILVLGVGLAQSSCASKELPLELVTLNTGEQVPRSSVVPIYMNLKKLFLKDDAPSNLEIRDLHTKATNHDDTLDSIVAKIVRASIKKSEPVGQDEGGFILVNPYKK